MKKDDIKISITEMLSRRKVQVLKFLNHSSYNKTFIAKELDIVYSHVDKIINEFKKYKLVEESELIGRVKMISLTKKGKKISDLLIKIDNII